MVKIASNRDFPPERGLSEKRIDVLRCFVTSKDFFYINTILLTPLPSYSTVNVRK